MLGIRLDILLNKLSQGFRQCDEYTLAYTVDVNLKSSYYDWVIQFINTYINIDDKNDYYWYVKVLESRAYYCKGCCENNSDLIEKAITLLEDTKQISEKRECYNIAIGIINSYLSIYESSKDYKSDKISQYISKAYVSLEKVVNEEKSEVNMMILFNNSDILIFMLYYTFDNDYLELFSQFCGLITSFFDKLIVNINHPTIKENIIQENVSILIIIMKLIIKIGKLNDILEYIQKV